MLASRANYDKKIHGRQVIPLAPGYRTPLSSRPIAMTLYITIYGKFNIRYNGPKLWNETDERFKILTPHLFKKELTKHFIKFY